MNLNSYRTNGLAVCRNNYDYNNLKDLDKLIDDLIEQKHIIKRQMKILN